MFSPTSGNGSPIELIPDNELAWVHMSIRDLKKSKTTQGEYFDAELIVADGPYANRRIYTVIMSPYDPNNNEKAREMGKIALTRILEACGVFDVNNPNTYANPAFAAASYQPTQTDSPESQAFAAVGMVLQERGKNLAIKVGLEPAKDGYQAKNTVKEWFTPNPSSNGNKGWAILMSGGTKTQEVRSTAFTGSPVAAPAPSAAPVKTFGTPAGKKPSWLAGGQ